MEYHESQEGEPQEELVSRETINTPATQIGKEQYCNFNQNDELFISIIFQHIDMPIFILAVHAPFELPPHPTQ